MMVTSCNRNRVETAKGYWSGWDQEWVSERNSLYNCISLEGTCLEWTKFFSLFPTCSWKAHNLHNVLGLIHLGLDSPKMLSTSNTRSYFSTCLKLTGIIHALKSKHMLCWKVPWICCRGKASVHPEDYVRGLSAFSSLELQKLMSFAAKAHPSRAVPWYCRHSEGWECLLLFTALLGEYIAGSATCWCVKQSHILPFSGIWGTWPCVCLLDQSAYRATHGVWAQDQVLRTCLWHLAQHCHPVSDASPAHWTGLCFVLSLHQRQRGSWG